MGHSSQSYLCSQKNTLWKQVQDCRVHTAAWISQESRVLPSQGTGFLCERREPRAAASKASVGYDPMALTMGPWLGFESEISPQAHVLKHVALHWWNWVGGISIRPWIEKAGHEEQTEEYIIWALLYVVPAFCLWLCGGRPPYVLNFNGLKLSGNPLFLSYVVNSGGRGSVTEKSLSSLKHSFSLSSLERRGHACCGSLERRVESSLRPIWPRSVGEETPAKPKNLRKERGVKFWMTPHSTQPPLPLPEVVISAPAPKIRWKPELFLSIKTDFISSNLWRIEEQGIKISAQEVFLAPPMPLCLPSPRLCSDTDQWLLKASCPEMASRLRQWGTQGDGRMEGRKGNDIL